MLLDEGAARNVLVTFRVLQTNPGSFKKAFRHMLCSQSTTLHYAHNREFSSLQWYCLASSLRAPISMRARDF